MIPRTFLNPHTGVLPFDMFRTFGPIMRDQLMRDQLPFSSWVPPCDIYETSENLVLKMELPEMKREDVHVVLEKNILTLSGERCSEGEVTKQNYYLVERNYGEFMRSFALPHFIDGNKVVAEFKEGVLTVTMPKNEAAMPKNIDVKVNQVVG